MSKHCAFTETQAWQWSCVTQWADDAKISDLLKYEHIRGNVRWFRWMWPLDLHDCDSDLEQTAGWEVWNQSFHFCCCQGFIGFFFTVMNITSLSSSFSPYLSTLLYPECLFLPYFISLLLFRSLSLTVSPLSVCPPWFLLFTCCIVDSLKAHPTHFSDDWWLPANHISHISHKGVSIRGSP